ncbi:MAG: DUF6941 family protein [Candidatus Sumerlaeaceae bacterium]|jgi:hypothetical protein
MRPHLKYFIQCDDVRNEQGKFSAVGIFDTIYSLFFPTNHPRFFVLIGFVGPKGTFPLEVHISAPDGHSIAEAKGKLQIGAPHQVANIVFCFENFPLIAPGQYTITLFLEGDFLAEFPFFARPPFETPKRTPEEVAALLERPDIVKSANADVQCPKCRSLYRFQHNLDPKAPVASGFLPLPPGDSFVCSVCATVIPIVQLRENLMRIVGVPESWLKAHRGAPQPPADKQPPQPSGEENDA